MEKKHGLIVGVTIIIIAVIVSLVANRLEGGKKESPKVNNVVSQGQQVQGQQVQVQQVQGQQVQGQQVQGQQVQGQQVQQVPEREETSVGDISKPSNGGVDIFEVEESIVKEPTTVENEVMLVADKKVMLIDMETNSQENKQMVYMLEMIGADGGKLSLYVNGVVYTDMKVGDTLQVKYNVYKNRNGVEIPLVLQATKVEVKK